jgi:hypothetical protein
VDPRAGQDNICIVYNIFEVEEPNLVGVYNCFGGTYCSHLQGCLTPRRYLLRNINKLLHYYYTVTFQGRICKIVGFI